MSVLAGRWAGQISGTNVGSFVLDLEVSGDALQGMFALQDFNQGAFAYDVVGNAEKNRISLTLTPRVYPQNAEVGTVQAEGLIQEDGSLSGEWISDVGTRGNFLGFKQGPVGAGTQPPPQPMAISYQKRRGAVPCAVDSELLRRIFRDLSTGSDEAARLEIARQAQNRALADSPATPITAFQHATVRGAYSVLVTARGRTGEQKIALDPAILEEGNLPKPIESVEFDIGAWHQLKTQQQASNRVRVVLDFTKPPPLEVSNPSSGPTQNNSYIEVIGNDSMWVSGVYEKVSSTLQQGRLRTGWIHTQYTYDVLLAVVGLPGAIALSTIFGRWLGKSYFGDALLPQFAGFILALFISLLVFRFSFSLIRWLLPLVEFSPPAQPLHRQIRIAVSTIVLGVIGSIAAAALWFALFPAS